MTTPDLRDPAHRVHPRARSMWLVECWISALGVIIGAVLIVLLTDFPGHLALAVVMAVGAVGYALVVPQWRYLVHRWEVTETAVYTQRGWWTRERRIAPMSRVQTVDFTQGVLSRLFGLATLTVTTASAAGELRIDGLDRETASRLADQLTSSAEAAGGDAT